VILAQILDRILLTIGQNPTVISNIEAMDACHTTTIAGEIVVDKEHKIVTAPCYMLDSRIDQISEEANRVIKELLDLAII
jgi:enhancing lycopene biosynthesis protein 2